MNEISVTTTLEHILESGCRLDATYYASDVFQAQNILDSFKENGGTVKKISDFSNGTYNPPPIKRIFTDDTSKGTPYMLPQEMFDFYWEPRKFVLANKMPKIEDWFLKEDWVVLTQSGTVGKPYFATKKDEEIVLSQNAIRIPPKKNYQGGYIYAYLSTWIGQTLLKKDKFGITVKHIRPHQVDSIPIPEIEEKKQKEISLKVKKAFELRKQAIKLLHEAKMEIYKELNAPETNMFDEEVYEAGEE
ncbi:MAG: restriction endonuclease subunit S [Chitinophagaceae bacterium]